MSSPTYRDVFRLTTDEIIPSAYQYRPAIIRPGFESQQGIAPTTGADCRLRWIHATGCTRIRELELTTTHRRL